MALNVSLAHCFLGNNGRHSVLSRDDCLLLILEALNNLNGDVEEIRDGLARHKRRPSDGGFINCTMKEG
jgi:hypothetical protein